MKKTSILALIVILLFTVTGCGGVVSQTAATTVVETSATTASTTIQSLETTTSGYEVTDTRGVTVSFDNAPDKIVSLLPSNTEIVYAFGLGDKLIAVSSYCNYPEDTQNKQKIDSGANTNVEAIIGLNPDVVLMGQMAQTEAQYKQLEDAGIKLIVTDATNIADTYKVIELLGNVFQLEDKATEIITGMKNEFTAIQESVKGKVPSNVYVEISPVSYGPWTCGKGTFQDELLTMIGANNIFADIDGWQKVSEEQVIERNPDFIFTTDMYSYPEPVDEILGRATWAEVKAIQNKKVFLTDGDQLTRPGPRLVDAAKELVRVIYSQ